MHSTLEKLLRWSSGFMSAIALFTIMWLTLIDVTGRKFFDHSLPGGLELTEIARGVDLERDRDLYTVSEGGIVVLGKGVTAAL